MNEDLTDDIDLSKDTLVDAVRHELAEQIDEDQLDNLGEEDIQNIVQESMERSIEELALHTYERILSDDEGLERYHETIEGFQEILEDRWGEPLELLERLIVWSMECGRAINQDHGFQARRNENYRFQALVHLHSRSVQVALEIHHLLKGGFADGAFARWRSLYELSITSSFISNHGDETAERFLSYHNIWEYYFAETYREHQDNLNVEPLEPEVLEELEEMKDELVKQFGKSIDDNGYGSGWAAEAHTGNGGPSLHSMKEEVDLEHLTPYYKLACESVHAGSKGTLDRLGIIRHEDIEQPDVLLSGPSNGGLNLPGQLTAISLAQVTTALLMMHLNSPSLADMLGMQMLVDDIEQGFAEASEALEQDDRKATKEWANQDIVDISLNCIDPSDLFSKPFLKKHTEFDSLPEFRDALPVDLDDVKNGDSVDPETDEVVQADSEFDSFQDLVDTALESWVHRNVDLSEFDIDDN
ncbi:DUF5677 domain-containing protein [Halococcus sp. IIIV-5B]|uniref:DUF5677 domain-containing protein n=1 Tax=Halococcus sp. IIIV-5B TaxID=2321230 RepID=UPI0018F57D44|nr:DUF5677 domain-containing protein [Halococcus sp. IIIV-5B]